MARARRMGEHGLVHAGLELLLEVGFVRVPDAVRDPALFRFLAEFLELVPPLVEDDAVLALFDEIEDQLVARIVDQAVAALVVVDRARGDLEQLRVERRRVDRGDRLAFDQRELAGLEVCVEPGVFRAEFDGACVLVVRRDVDAVLELMADDHVVDEGYHRVLDAILVDPFDVLGRRAVLDRRAGLGPEVEEARAEALAFVEDVNLMPEVADALRHRRAAHQPAPFEVLGEFGDGLAAFALRVLVGGRLVNDDASEAGPVCFWPLDEVGDCVDVCDVDVGRCGEGLLAVVRPGDADLEVRSELADVVGPGGFEQGLRRQDEQGFSVLLVLGGEVDDLDQCLARTRRAHVEDAASHPAELERFELVAHWFHGFQSFSNSLSTADGLRFFGAENVRGWPPRVLTSSGFTPCGQFPCLCGA